MYNHFEDKHQLLTHAGWLLELYILATSKVISAWVPTCDQCTLMGTYSAAPLEDQAANTMF